MGSEGGMRGWEVVRGEGVFLIEREWRRGDMADCLNDIS